MTGLVLAAAIAVAPLAFDVRSLERERVLAAATAFLKEDPVTVTSTSSPRSTGGPHDFFSEGDYWWPPPGNPGGAYVRRDGRSNPDNFVGHRQCLMRLSRIVPALAAAWVLTGEGRYSERAARHLRAWFLDEATRMTPHLRYAQAIHGVSLGRGTGIIDTIHLVEVAQAVRALESAPGLSKAERDGVVLWLPDGRGLRRAVAFMAPFIRDRKLWPFPPDVMYDEQWPMRQASLLFAGLSYGESSYLDLWKTLPADSPVDEVIRNFFVRQPVLWVP